MEAWNYSSQGNVSTVLSQSTLPRPKITKPSEVLARIHASALNPVDLQLIETKSIILSYSIPKPAIPGFDFSGVVEEGDEQAKWKKGDQVFGMKPFSNSQGGTLAEYIVMDSSLLVRKPDNLSHIEAASIPLVFLTAYHALFYWGQLPKNGKGRVFINGGSGGVGTVAIMIAKAYGAHVTTTCSQKNIELVKKLGADEVIDYNATPIETLSKAAELNDTILDCVGGPTLWYKADDLLKPKGIYVTIVGDKTAHNEMGGPYTYLTYPKQIVRSLLGYFGYGSKGGFQYWCIGLKHENEPLEKAVTLINEGKFKPIIDSVHAFKDVIPAFEFLKSGRAKGKIIIETPK